MNAGATMLVELDHLDSTGIAGGKAYNLGRMARLGLPTPGGLVIPDAVFQQHLKNCGVLPAIAGMQAELQNATRAQLESASATIRRCITETGLSVELQQALERETEKRWPGQKLAVRSSADGEDTAETSFAGQLDSQLNVDTFVALETAVKATWASLYSLRVLLYARHKRMALQHMGVIVQPMVPARLSGVLFTRDPTGRQPGSMLIEYVSGLGERLVSGAVTPSRMRIERNTLAAIAEFIASASDALDAETMVALRQLAKLALALEGADGIAQDIEWCIDDSRRVILVQARPAAPSANRRSSRLHHWSNANIAENFPEPVSPFLFSIVRPGYSAYFRKLGLGFGVSRRRIDAAAIAFDNIVGLQGGRLYYNLSNIHRLLQLMPGGRRLKEYFNLFVGAEDTPETEMPVPGRIALAFESLRIVASVCWQYLFVQKRMCRFESRIAEFAERTQPALLNERSAAELASDLRGFLKIRLEYWNDAALADTAAMVCYGLLKSRLTHWLKVEDHSGLHNDLLKGLPGLASAMPVTKLWELSRHIEANDALKTLFLNADTGQVLHAIRQPAFAEFAKAFDEYLEQWGFRSSAELMLTKPTPVEDPRPLIELLRAYLRPDTVSPDARAREQTNSRLSISVGIERLISPGKVWRAVPLLSAASRFRLLLRATHGAIRLRERARMKQALLYTRLRHIALQLGACLVERKVLRLRDDIFMLATDEVLALVAGASADDVSEKVECRRNAMEAFATMQPPDRIELGEGEEWRPAAAPMPVSADAREARPLPAKLQEKLRGVSACGGQALGDAAVVLDVSEAGRVQAGQILVTRQTDPGWATVFFLVQGLVIERGGMLSHGAIIAREYGIPAVIGVADATRLIRDGDRLRVDGDLGLVEYRHG